MTPADWNALAERCEQAKGPDRSIGRDIALAVGWQRFTPSQVRRKHPAWITPGDYLGRNSDGSPVIEQMHGTDLHRDAPPFESCLTAIKALIELELPGWAWTVNSNGYAALYKPTEFLDPPAPPTVETSGQTPARGLCAALCRAKGAGV